MRAVVCAGHVHPNATPNVRTREGGRLSKNVYVVMGKFSVTKAMPLSVCPTAPKARLSGVERRVTVGRRIVVCG